MVLTIVLTVLSVLAGVSAVPSADTLAVCKALYSKYPQNFAWDPLGASALQTAANASLYSEIDHDYWNEHNADNRAACMFFPSNADEVSYAVKTLSNYTDVPYALKSGGHNPNFGYSSVDQGLLISFRPNLANTTISEDHTLAYVGPGSRWDEAMTVLDKYGKAIIGGRLGHVGVGGYTLGGGLSFLTSQYGFACDAVTNYELVLADGTIANANETSNPDLFYALKGGGNQFGIITTYTMKTFSIGQVWGGVRIYDGAQYHSQLLEATTNFTRDFHDPKSAVIVTFDYALYNLANLAVIFFFYDGPEPPVGVFDEYMAVPAISDSTKTQSYPDLLIANNEFSLSGLRYQLREATYPNLPLQNMTDFYDQYWTQYNDFAFSKDLSNLDIQVFSFAIQPIPVAIAQASNEAGGNRLGLDPANGDRIFMEHDVSWLNPVCDDSCPGYLETLVDQLQSYQQRTFHGISPTNYESGDLDFISYNPIFMNDGMYDQNVLQSYGDGTYQKLKQIQMSRDPHGFFSTRQGGFKFTT